MKRHRSTVKGGRPNVYRGKGVDAPSRYQARLRDLGTNVDATKGAMQASLYHGYQATKPQDERRPKRGGRVRGPFPKGVNT